MTEPKFQMTPKVSPEEAQKIIEGNRAKQMPNPPVPHKYTPYARGIPIINMDAPDVEMPAMNFPYEAHHSIGVHLERAGFIHVDELHAMAVDGMIREADLPPVWYVHIKPKHGPDIPTNPGTWEPPTEENQAATVLAEAPPIPTEEIVDASPAKLEAMQRAILEEQIKQAKIKHTDPPFVEDVAITEE